MTGQRALMMGARVLSVISRPYYMPVVGFLALFTFTYLSLLPLFYKLLVLSMVWIFTIALPRLCVFVWRKLNGWVPMQLRLRERRAVPYVMFMLSYTACLHLMFRLHLPHYMCGILVAALLVQAVCIVVNIWWKISMHCAGAGAIIGALLAVIFCVCVFGGSTQISKITGILVPLMGIFYLAVALFIVVTHFELIPKMFADIFTNAFDLQAIFGGFTGSCIMQGIKRGLFSNEAGVGSAPNAAASASVSHPAKQGLVQMLSVFIDTIVICSATSFMLLCSGVAPSEALKGMPWVQAAAAESLGSFGTIFITVALFMFAFTTLIGNYFYAEMGLGYLCDKKPGKKILSAFRIFATVVVFGGSLMEFSVAWSTADVIMGFLALINLPVIILLGGPAVRCLKDYRKQKKEGKNPVFKASDIHLADKTDFWN